MSSGNKAFFLSHTAIYPILTLILPKNPPFRRKGIFSCNILPSLSRLLTKQNGCSFQKNHPTVPLHHNKKDL